MRRIKPWQERRIEVELPDLGEYAEASYETSIEGTEDEPYVDLDGAVFLHSETGEELKIDSLSAADKERLNRAISSDLEQVSETYSGELSDEIRIDRAANAFDRYKDRIKHGE